MNRFRAASTALALGLADAEISLARFVRAGERITGLQIDVRRASRLWFERLPEEFTAQ